MRNLPFHDTNKNRIWIAIAALAQDLLAWCARLALPDATDADDLALPDPPRGSGFSPGRRPRAQQTTVAERSISTIFGSDHHRM